MGLTIEGGAYYRAGLLSSIYGSEKMYILLRNQLAEWSRALVPASPEDCRFKSGQRHSFLALVALK